MAKTKKIAVIGFGNIGTGVVRLLYEKGIPGLELVRVVDTDIKRKRPVEIPSSYLSTDWRQTVADPKIDIVVELIGGIEPARSILSEALKQGKDVVTANKKLLAKEGESIFKQVADSHRRIGFRAAFVGAHSLIHELGLAGTGAKEFKRIHAILNGTSNYILSSMTSEGMSFEQALRGAQAKGFAEADPSDDIDGRDTESKIRILLALISNSYRSAGAFPVEGVRDMAPQDIQYAGELGYSVKLVGVIEQNDSIFDVAVHPALVPKMSLLGSLEGAYNGTELEDEYGTISGLVAPGAGAYPTADAVVKDLLDITEGRTMPMPSSAAAITLGAIDAVRRRYYLRFSVLDQAGVLARITDIFWKHNISIAAVIQKEAVSEDFVPVVITTHLAKEGDLQAAIAQVDNLEVVKAKTRIIRILSGEA
ncbi:MAG: homoserine dehydrogenase [Chloroflexi bacterium]|nr:homoserine dehydrogenase [Chloroflexota bacterium]